MDNYEINNSGINSLRGFSYQIRVFVYYILTMNKNMQAEFETIDDISIKNTDVNNIDKYEDKYIEKIRDINGKYTAIQVKHTLIDNGVAEKIIYNWLLIETSNIDVEKYILFTDSEYKNSDNLFTIPADIIYKKVMEAKDKKSNSLIAKVKKKYNNKIDEFEKDYNEIKGKYTFISEGDINELIYDAGEVVFRKAAVSDYLYISRITEFLQHITIQVLNAISYKKPYLFTFNELMSAADNICGRFTETKIEPHYTEFKKTHPVDFSDIKISNSREVKQLFACGLEQKLIEQQMQYRSYYYHTRLLSTKPKE